MIVLILKHFNTITFFFCYFFFYFAAYWLQEILKQQLAEKQDTTVKLQREKDLAASHKSDTQKVGSSKQTSNVKTENKGNSFSPTQEVSRVILMQNA